MTTCLWPGLPRLWFRGDWGALAGALAFAIGLDACLLLGILWPERLPASISGPAWGGLILGWIGGIIWNLRGWSQVCGPADDPGLFIQARGEYLRGRWQEAESLLRAQLEKSQSDVECRLLLVSVYRRSGQFDRARRQLRFLRRLEDATVWRNEIEREEQILKRQQGEMPSPGHEPPSVANGA